MCRSLGFEQNATPTHTAHCTLPESVRRSLKAGASSVLETGWSLRHRPPGNLPHGTALAEKGTNRRCLYRLPGFWGFPQAWQAAGWSSPMRTPGSLGSGRGRVAGRTGSTLSPCAGVKAKTFTMLYMYTRVHTCSRTELLTDNGVSRVLVPLNPRGRWVGSPQPHGAYRLVTETWGTASASWPLPGWRDQEIESHLGLREGLPPGK